MWVVAQRNPKVFGGIDVLEPAESFWACLKRCDELDPDYTRGLMPATMAGVQEHRRKAIGFAPPAPERWTPCPKCDGYGCPFCGNGYIAAETDGSRPEGRLP